MDPATSSAPASSTSTAGGAPYIADAKIEAMSTLLAQNWWAVALRGLCGIVFGLIALYVPGATILTLVLFFAAYMLVDGILGVVAAVRAAGRHERWGLLVLEGILNIAIGVIALVWPGLTALTFVFLVAAWAIVTGVLMVVAAVRLHPEYGRWWLILSGVASLIFGVLLVIAPLVGLVVLTWWMAAYALFFGIMLLALAFRLRGRKDAGTPLGAPTAAATPR
jgi:uncharacterized membrane protein HdeD (DUF308 family)